MARVNHKARLIASTANLSSAVAGQLADLIESMTAMGSAEEISEMETAVRSSRRKAKAEAAEKPARKTRRAKAVEEDEDEKPARRTRRAAKAEVAEKPARRTRRAKAETLPEDVTVDQLFDILEEFEGEPVEGTLRDLKPIAESYGLDTKAFLADLEGTPKEKAAELGMFIAACKAIEAQIVATLKADDAAMDEILEELGLDVTGRASKIAKAIVVALNTEAEEGDDEDEDEDGDDADADEEDEDEDEKPARRTRRAAKAEEKPARSSRRKPKMVDEDEADEDDLDDLDDLDEE